MGMDCLLEFWEVGKRGRKEEGSKRTWWWCFEMRASSEKETRLGHCGGTNAEETANESLASGSRAHKSLVPFDAGKGREGDER